MKKGIILFGILAVLFLFTACGAKEDIDNSENVLAESIGQTEKNSTEKSSESANGAVAKVDEQSLLEQQLRFLYLKTEKQTPKSLPPVV